MWGQVKNINNIYWICGGSTAGETTMSKLLQEKFNFKIYDIDHHVDGYQQRFNFSGFHRFVF